MDNQRVHPLGCAIYRNERFCSANSNMKSALKLRVPFLCNFAYSGSSTQEETYLDISLRGTHNCLKQCIYDLLVNPIILMVHRCWGPQYLKRDGKSPEIRMDNQNYASWDALYVGMSAFAVRIRILKERRNIFIFCPNTSLAMCSPAHRTIYLFILFY